MPALSSVSEALPQVGALISTPTMVWATLFFFGVTTWMIVVVFFVKWQQQVSLRRDQQLIGVWEECFFAAITGDEILVLPAVKSFDRRHVLKIWCHIGNNVAGDALDRLSRLGLRLGIDQIALAILVPGGLRLANPSSVDVLLALRAAERMQIKAAWEPLKRIVRVGPAPLDRFAARALVAIDATAAAPEILPALIRQGRWASHLVEDLMEVGVADAVEDYAALLDQVSDEAVPGLALLLNRCNNPNTVPAIRRRLAVEQHRDPDALAALLNTLSLVGGQSERKLVNSFIGHQEWFVRMRAAQAMGRCGDLRDAGVLESLISDRNWYTRYHAARSMLAIGELGQTYLEDFAQRTRDPFAHDMALHVLGEAEAPALR